MVQQPHYRGLSYSFDAREDEDGAHLYHPRYSVLCIIKSDFEKSYTKSFVFFSHEIGLYTIQPFSQWVKEHQF